MQKLTNHKMDTTRAARLKQRFLVIGLALIAVLVFLQSSPAIAVTENCHYLDPQEITLAMTEPQLYFNDIELIPQMNSEVPQQWLGYQVGFLRPDSWVSQFGLKSGDLIAAVNEVSIQDLVAFNQELKSIPQLQQFSLTIERDSSALQLHFLYGEQAQCPLDINLSMSEAEVE